MLSSVSVIGFGLVYICLLFLIAYVADKRPRVLQSVQRSNLVYSLSIAVYCSSWTFYGAVGSAVSVGFDYLAIYLGPCLVFIFGYPFIKRIIKICKVSNITSISDFIASRFGRSKSIAVLVTLIAFTGSIPYIALQIKAITMSFSVLVSGQVAQVLPPDSALSDPGFYVMLVLALFTILFGTRHFDATEHHPGLITAVAFESIIKLIAILAVGYYCVFLLLEALSIENASLLENEIAQQSMTNMLNDGSSTWQSFLTKTILSIGAIVLLPRQFHVAIVEARSHHQFKTVAWVMPIYFILTSIVILPIAITGVLLLPGGQEDLYVLSLPMDNGNELLALIAFIGGASAATGMVIVAAVSLSTMISNDLVMPIFLKFKGIEFFKDRDLGDLILLVRRLAIVCLLITSYGFYAVLDANQQLANMGLLAFAAIIQLLPAMIAALYWQKAHTKGAFWGLVSGFCIWLYCLLLPTLLSDQSLNTLFKDGFWLHPQSLFGITMNDSLTHGVFWSLFVNTFVLIVLSLLNDQEVIERIQAQFFRSSKPIGFFTEDSKFKELQIDLSTSMDNTTIDELHTAIKLSEHSRVPVTLNALRQVADKFIGVKNTDALIQQFSGRQNLEAADDVFVDAQLLSQVNTAMSGVIGSASAQKVMTDNLLDGETYLGLVSSTKEKTSEVLQFNRNLMQITLENISHGISVIDKELNLVIWNTRYLNMFEYPKDRVYTGMPIRELLEFNASRGEFANEDPKKAVAKRLKHLIQRQSYEHISHRKNGRIIKLMGEPMKTGGYVTTYQDITESVNAEKMLQQANEDLEWRVLERTKELEFLTEELKKATQSKTHFLAAASHDLLQPINAARLFNHSIKQRKNDELQVQELANNVEQSLNNANYLLSALLDVSKLDAGGIKPEMSDFLIQDLIQDVVVEFEGRADAKQVELSVVPSKCIVHSDRRLLFSVVQNLVSNAVRYTQSGDKITIGVRHRLVQDDSESGQFKQFSEIQILDSGKGISEEDIGLITQEFYRVGSNSKEEKSRGLGLGLSIAKRIAELLDVKLRVESEFGKGSLFSIAVPKSEVSQESLMDENSIQVGDEMSFDNQHTGLRVLCLENDFAVLQSLINVLEGWKCEVLAASDFDEGIDLLSSDVDLVLADYHLDDHRTGEDFFKGVVSRFPQVRGCLLTAADDDALFERIEAAGYEWLRKPLDIEALKRLVLNPFKH